ncbi:MAG: tetratricopeptide repeat protein, partial [Candidatus Desantisbacteria bacterium]
MYCKLDKHSYQILKTAAIAAVFICSFSLTAFPQTAKETFLKGNEYLRQENYQQAITAYQQTIKSNPYHKTAYHNLGRCYLNLNLFTKAEECFKKALKLDPDYISAINKLGVAYEYQKRYKEAWNCYNKILSINPIEAEAHYNLASLFQKKRDFERAILHAKRAVKTKPDYVEAFIKLGDIYWKSYHDMNKAVMYYKRAKEIEPENRLVRSCLSEMYVQEGLLEDAERECLEIVSIDPLSLTAMSQLVKIYTHQGRYEKIGPICQQIASITPSDSRMLSYSSVLSSMITILVDQGMEKNADILSQKLVSLTPGSKTFNAYISTLTNLITFMFDKKRYEKAAPFCKKITTLVPSGKGLNSYRGTLNRLIRLYFINKRYKDSIPLCQRAIGISPSDGIAHYQLSIAYKGMGEYKGCTVEALKACRIDPFDEIFWHIVEKGVLDLNRQQVGTPLRNECSKRHLEMAQHYFRLGNIPLAEYEYKKARQLNPQSIAIRLGLAKCYEEQELKLESVEELEKVLELDPENNEAKDKIEMIWKQKTSSIVKGPVPDV